MFRPECKLNFEQRQEVDEIIERIAGGRMDALEQELYALVYDRDSYKAKAEGLGLNEHLV